MTVHALCRLDEFGNADGKLPLDDANAGQSKRAPGGEAGATGYRTWDLWLDRCSYRPAASARRDREAERLGRAAVSGSCSMKRVARVLGQARAIPAFVSKSLAETSWAWCRRKSGRWARLHRRIATLQRREHRRTMLSHVVADTRAHRRMRNVPSRRRWATRSMISRDDTVRI